MKAMLRFITVLLIICMFPSVSSALLEVGTVKVIKMTPYLGSELFDFTGSGSLGQFSLIEGGEILFEDLPAGNYDLTEIVPAGWVLQDIDIITDDLGDTSAVDLVNNSVSIDLDDQEMFEVTFYNVPEPATLGILSIGSVILRIKRKSEN